MGHNPIMNPQQSIPSLEPIMDLIALFDNNQRNVIRALKEEGWHLHPQTLSNWKNGHMTIPAKWCGRFEKISNGAVTREMLRPDIFGEV